MQKNSRRVPCERDNNRGITYEEVECEMVESYQNILKEELLIKVIRKLAYELSQKEEMLKIMKWSVDLETGKQTRRFCYDKEVK